MTNRIKMQSRSDVRRWKELQLAWAPDETAKETKKKPMQEINKKYRRVALLSRLKSATITIMVCLIAFNSAYAKGSTHSGNRSHVARTHNAGSGAAYHGFSSFMKGK